MRRAIGLAVLGGTLALFAVGCGGGGSGGAKPLPKAVYVQQMQTIGRSLSTSLNKLSSATGSAKKAATALEQVQTDLRSAAVKIDAMTPPPDVAADQAKLSAAVREFANELAPLIVQLKAGKLSALSSLTSLKGIADIQTASTGIANKGYKIGG